MAKVTIGVRVKQDLLEKIKKEAEINKKTITQVVVEILEKYFNKQPIQELIIVEEAKPINRSIFNQTIKPLKIPPRNTDLFIYKGERTRLTILSRKLKLSIEEVKEKLRCEGYE